MGKRFYRVITKFSDEGFKPLPRKTIYHNDNYIQVVKNLYILIKVPDEIFINLDKKNLIEPQINISGYNIMDYAWSKNVEKQFKEHPYHQEFFKKICSKSKNNKFRIYGIIWSFNNEPICLDERINNELKDIASDITEYYCSMNDKTNIIDIRNEENFRTMIRNYIGSEQFKEYVDNYLNIKQKLKQL